MNVRSTIARKQQNDTTEKHKPQLSTNQVELK